MRGPAAAALVHPQAEGTGLIPTQVLSDELAAEQGGDGMPVDASSIPAEDPGARHGTARDMKTSRIRKAPDTAAPRRSEVRASADLPASERSRRQRTAL